MSSPFLCTSARLPVLIATRKRDVHRRVPILADIPLLGDLFRYDLAQQDRAELLIILTPHVAGHSPRVAERHLAVLLENVRRFAAGKTLINVVDKEKWF